MKKGFTLIELLTVIVILSIIMLVTVPVITDVINDSRKNTFRISLESLVKVAKNDYNQNGRVGAVTYTLSDNKLTYIVQGEVIEVKYKGSLKGASGTITIDDTDITMDISNDVYKGEYINEENAEKGKIEKVVVTEEKKS